MSYNLAIVENNFINIYENCRNGAYLFYIAEAKNYHNVAIEYEKAGFILKDAIFHATKDKTYIIGILQKEVYKTYADNAIKFNCGGLNIDKCRISHNEPLKLTNRQPLTENGVFNNESCGFKIENNKIASANPSGRYPANFIISLDLADTLDSQSGSSKNTGGASRFFKNTKDLIDLYKYLLDLGIQPDENEVYSNISEIKELLK